ncbi:hypothetical protein B296_00018390, partial [Ensete ventricosum]
TTRNWSVAIDFDHRQPLPSGNNQFRPLTGNFRQYQKKREKKRENLESDAALPIPIRHPCDPSPAGDFFSPGEEKKCLTAINPRLVHQYAIKDVAVHENPDSQAIECHLGQLLFKVLGTFAREEVGFGRTLGYKRREGVAVVFLSFLVLSVFKNLSEEMRPEVGMMSPGNNMHMYYGGGKLRAARRMEVAEVVLRCAICGLGVLAAALIGSATQVREFFSAEKKARFTDMKALV